MGNPEVRRVVEQCVQEHVTEYLELHPDALDLVLSKSLNALKVYGLFALNLIDDNLSLILIVFCFFPLILNIHNFKLLHSICALRYACG